MGNRDWLTGGRRAEVALAAIHAAATDQLLEAGLAKFTAEAVARRAGCSRATLYRIAGGKRALLDAVLAQGAIRIVEKVGEGIADLEGGERIAEAILVGLRELRADPVVNDWVRRAALTGDFLQSSADLADLAGSWRGDAEVSPLAGTWILRVFLQFVAWPGPDPQTEEMLVRRFVAPAFAA